MSALSENNKENQSAVQRPPSKMQKVDVVSTLQVKLLSEAATVPRRGSAHAAGYDLARFVLVFSQASDSAYHCVTHVLRNI